ncbi:phospholipid methyltransferase-domain-containing protein [Limtongia smithiae]|uniref:phospholipid methyltransferase-domain-containing protein n=1 Tax=Limtongia smithiae TaxID=1125753 RepID=UPI0034CE8FC2
MRPDSPHSRARYAAEDAASPITRTAGIPDSATTTAVPAKASLLSKSKHRLMTNKDILAKKYVQRKAALAQKGAQLKKLKRDIKIADYLKPDTSKVTYGRTPDGTVFPVPVTEDMVTALFDPSKPKSLADILTLTILTSYVILLFVLPSSIRKWVFLAIYTVSRLSYNGGLGYLLYQQSFHRRLTQWAAQSQIFAKPGPNAGYLKRTTYSLVKRELSTKMGKDYKFDAVPLEYNTWLLFRRLVDLILMSDFTSYMLLAACCFNVPENQSMTLHIGRWAAGIFLFVFNLFVKLDAHRVIKDYAWYWGDFFFLEDLQLCFDGIFELVPHPMYSVGYAGYYGISLMVASYTLLGVSVAAHVLQFVFLFLVENPRTFSVLVFAADVQLTNRSQTSRRHTRRPSRHKQLSRHGIFSTSHRLINEFHDKYYTQISLSACR